MKRVGLSGFFVLALWIWGFAAQAAVNAPIIVQVGGQTVIGGQRLWLNQSSNLTVMGNAESGTTVTLYNGASSIDTAISVDGVFSMNVTLNPGNHNLTAIASDGVEESSPSAVAQIGIDVNAPALGQAYFRNVGWETLGHPSQVMLRFGLGSIMQADVNDSGGSGLNFTTATIALYDLGPWNALYSVPVQVMGNSANDGVSRITFVPHSPAQAGNNNHRYRSVVSIADRAGNLSTQTAEWFRDDTPPAAPVITEIYDPSVGAFRPYDSGMIIGGQPIKIKGVLNPRGAYRSQPPNGFHGYSVVSALHDNHWSNCTVYGAPGSHGQPLNPATGEFIIDYAYINTGNPTYDDPNTYIFPEGLQNIWVDSVDTAQSRTRATINLNFGTGAPPPPQLPSGFVAGEMRIGPTLDFPMAYPVFNGNARASSAVQTVCIYQADFYSFTLPSNYDSAYKVCQQVLPSGQSYTHTPGVYNIGDAFADSNNNWQYDPGELFMDSVSALPGFPASNGLSYRLPNVRNLPTPLGESVYVGIGSANVTGRSVTQRVARLHYNTGLPQLQSLAYHPVDAQIFSMSTQPSQITARVRTSGEDWCRPCHELNPSQSTIAVLNNQGTVLTTGLPTQWVYTGADLISNGTLNLPGNFFSTSGTFTLRLDLTDNMLNRALLANNTFKVDYEAPIAQNITPSMGTVSSIPSFNADMADPALADGTAGTGVSLDPTENQIDAYRVLAVSSTVLPTSSNTLTLAIETPIGGAAVDHRGSTVPVSPASLPAGAAIQIWDISDAANAQIMGMPTATGNSIVSNAIVTANTNGSITVQSTVGVLPANRTYAIMYLIPHFDSNDGVQKLAAVPTQPAIASGQYASRITARDRVGNVGTTVSTTLIQMDPPSGTFTLTPSPLDVYIMEPGSRSVITSSVIQGSNLPVPDGTYVTVSISGPGFIVEPDANSFPGDGFQVATAANGAGTGQIRFQVEALDTSTIGTVTLSASVGAATGEATIIMRRPVVSITKATDVSSREPGQIITYTLSYQNAGNSAANNVTVRDRLPAGVSYVANSLRHNGALQNNDAALFNASQGPSGQINFPVGWVEAGANGNISFQVIVN